MKAGCGMRGWRQRTLRDARGRYKLCFGSSGWYSADGLASNDAPDGFIFFDTPARDSPGSFLRAHGGNWPEGGRGSRMSGVEWLLIFWSGAATTWWLLALWLVCSHEAPGRETSPETLPDLTVFKPLPSEMSGPERAALAEAVASFAGQLGLRDELLLGVPEAEIAHWRRFAETCPTRGNLLVCGLPSRATRANPKVARLETLAPLARGALWLWSDADIVAPPNLLTDLKRALTRTGVGAVTCPYCVRRAGGMTAVPDAAFVNAEFLPGALLLGRLGSVEFAFGAATIFRAADFHARVSWERLGAALADDYALGQQLKPVVLAGPMVETLALETTVASAVSHYYRWQKTIRWCRPGSYAALLAVTPLLGWGVLAAVQSASGMAWLGFGLQWGIECVALGALCRAVRCRMSPGAWAALVLWPPLRALTWLAVWLPLAVTWRGVRQRWLRRPA
jgi:ceramide glucosyltransferase